MSDLRRLGLPAVLAVVVALSGCRTPSYLCVAPKGLKRIEIASIAESNAGRPIAVDLVYVTAKPAAAAMGRLKARDYFNLRDQLGRDYPRQLTTEHWELQAGQQLATQVTPPCNVAGAFLFANYQSDGDHRVVVGKKAKSGLLSLRPDDIVWAPKK